MIDWLVAHGGTIGDVFALASSICLFIPLIGLVSLSRQFRDFAKLGTREGFKAEDIDAFRQQVIDERQADGQVVWLILAGIGLTLATLFLAVSILSSL